MEIKVAVFGSPDLVEYVMNIGKQYEVLNLLRATYSHPEEVTELVKKYSSEVDVLLFAAPVPYLLTRDYLSRSGMELNKPMLFVPYTEASFYRGMFTTLRQTGLGENKLTFSIDYLPETGASECLEELEKNIDQTYKKKCSLDQDLDKLFSFHYDLWSQGKTVSAMTCYYLVYQKLKNLGVPTFRIMPAKSAIRHTLQRVLIEGRSVHQAESQIAIGIIGFSPDGDDINLTVSKSEIKRRKVALQQILVDYGVEIQSLIDWCEDGKIRLVTTRGKIEENTAYFSKVPILQVIHSKVKVPVFFGIGFGYTANEAEIKAYEAYSKARSTGDGSCFVVESDGKVHGPIGKPSQLEYFVRSNDPSILFIAKKAGLSIGTINKLISFNESLENKVITAVDLAGGFGISTRSARRILSKLEQHNFARIIGEEQPVSKGRPRQIYKLTIENRH